MDSGDAHRLARQAGAKPWSLLQPRFFRYDLPRFVRGDTVESLEEADDTADRGDQPSESDSDEDGGVSDSSYVGSRGCGRRSGFRGIAGV
jgi:hypothetical protein